METRCPNPRCRNRFEVPDDQHGRNGACPRCGQVITYRPVALLEAIERQHELRKNRPQKRFEPGQETLPPFMALLDDIRSLWNVGSMFRSADGAGFGGLILSGITGTPPDKALAKTALGAEDSVPWMHAPQALEVLQGLRARGVLIVALEKNARSVAVDAALKSGVLRTPLCLVMGNEVSGVSPEAASVADVTIHLPMHGMKESLNVAVAFGVAAYALRMGLQPGG